MILTVIPISQMPHFGQKFAIESRKADQPQQLRVLNFENSAPSPETTPTAASTYSLANLPLCLPWSSPQGVIPALGEPKLSFCAWRRCRPLVSRGACSSPAPHLSGSKQPESSRRCHRHPWAGPAGDRSSSSSLALARPCSLTAKLVASEAKHCTGSLSTTPCSLPRRLKTKEGFSTHSLVTLD